MSEPAGFRGGSRTAAGTPTAVGGGIAPPGSGGGTPTAVGGGQIHEARNNRGSNVQIPYCRVVPLHGGVAPETLKAEDRKLRDLRVHAVNGEPKLEYDGLNTGELAWVLGRRFLPVADADQGDLDANQLDETASLSQRRVYQAGGGAGRGVDRMQRLATTGWVEARMVSKEVREAQIDLHRINLTSPYALAMHAGLAQNETFLAGSTALDAADVAHSMARVSGSVTRDPVTKAPTTTPVTVAAQRQGIYVLDKGPFLRGTQSSGAAVALSAAPGVFAEQHFARNLGDTLAFAGLETELRRRNIFAWTPDGIVLSAGDEGPDPINSVNLDAKSARVYNVGVQGPAVTTSWRINVDTGPTVGGWALDAQPGDKLFVCLVADVSFTVLPGKVRAMELQAAREDVVKAAGDPTTGASHWAKEMVRISTGAKIAHGSAMQPGDSLGEDFADDAETKARSDYESALGGVRNRVKDATDKANPAPGNPDCTEHGRLVKARIAAAKALEELQSKKETPAAQLKAAQTTHDEALAAERAVFGEWDADKTKAKAQLDALDEIAASVRSLKSLDVGCATLSNFRLMRTSSSQMANFSHFRPGKPATSRMGLKLWAPANGSSKDGVSEYIVGGWCIGTVLDARSSRVTTMTPNIGVNHDIRPKNVALNVMVNVQWCSGDELYKSYMDTSGMVLKRGDNKREGAELDDADVDVARDAGAPAPAPAPAATPDPALTAPGGLNPANPNNATQNDVIEASAAGGSSKLLRLGGARGGRRP